MAVRSARDNGITRLYKFRGLSKRERIEPIFRSQALYWPSFSELNDPFESKPIIAVPPMRTELEKHKVEKQAYSLLRRNDPNMDRREAKRRSEEHTSELQSR